MQCVPFFWCKVLEPVLKSLAKWQCWKVLKRVRSQQCSAVPRHCSHMILPNLPSKKIILVNTLPYNLSELLPPIVSLTDSQSPAHLFTVTTNCHSKPAHHHHSVHWAIWLNLTPALIFLQQLNLTNYSHNYTLLIIRDAVKFSTTTCKS